MSSLNSPFSALVLGIATALCPLAHAANISVTIEAGAKGKAISPDLFGIFFEDLNYAADGGLYAELIQNRSFEYQSTEQPGWNPLSFWEVTVRGSGKGSLVVNAADPVHTNNPHYGVLDVSQVGEGVGIANSGFGGIVLQAGASYDVSLFAKHLYTGERWSHDSNQGPAAPLIVRLENKEGEILAEATLPAPGREWTHLTTTLVPKRSEPTARFVVYATATGGVALDVISLFPQKTFHHHAGGLRADLAQVIGDLHPKFMRFPGGCLVHGDGLGNMYRWKDTIGPIEQRKEQANLWGYHQSVGLGYFEYFQFCEDIGAKPLPVVAAGVCCQNSGLTNGTGQKGLPLELMPDYIQEVLDLIEYANGPTSSVWGAKRAAAGHPAPFNLQYVGVGNEDHITSVFKERFKLIYEAVKVKHPEITVVGTVGPFPDGEDFTQGWKIADELAVPVVDEHYYKSPQWFLENNSRYDSYDRAKSQVYVGEYAADDDKRRSTLRSALAEAAFMAGLERNGDVVRMASYAPLLSKIGNSQWSPDLIYFNNTGVFPTLNYYVQQLFSTHAGDTWLPFVASGLAQAPEVAFSAVRDSHNGELFLKLVNPGDSTHSIHFVLKDASNLGAQGVVTVLTGDPLTVNDNTQSTPLHPITSTLSVGPTFDYECPAHSLTVFRLPRESPKTAQ